MSFEEYQSAQAAKKQQQAQKKAQGGGQLTLEEYQAQQAAKKAQKAAAPVQPTRIQERGAKLEELQPAPASVPAVPAVAEPPVPATELRPPEDSVAADDWEAQADGPAEASAGPAKEESQAEEPPPHAEEPKQPEPEVPEPKVPEPKAPQPKEPEEEGPVPAAVPAAKSEPPPVQVEVEEEVPEKVEKSGPTSGKELATPDPRAHLNVVFIGHVDAGKSTTCGNVLYLCGCVDERTIEKYMKEAKDKNRESWFLAYIMDTNEEEKAKGKTVEVGRAHFETERRRWTILDAPGHKSYVPNMIGGASQADIGVLIISARKGEFETGFERGGQTREHALLAKTLGVEKLVIAINKMDDHSVEWKQERYDEIQKKLAPFLKSSGFKDDQVVFLPISGLTGDNVKERKNTPDWYQGMTLLNLLDSLEVPKRNPDLPLRIPMLDGYKDMGATMAIGKVEQGTVKPGMKCTVMPIGHKCTVVSVFINDVEMSHAGCGENVTMKMAGVSEEQLCRGFVLSAASDPVRVVTKFKAQLQLIELPEERPVLTSGYRAVIHVHVAIEECEILKLYESMSMTDRKKKEKNPRFVRENSIVTCSIQLARPTSIDAFTGVQQLGRFTLRDEGRTIAIGKITELPKA